MSEPSEPSEPSDSSSAFPFAEQLPAKPNESDRMMAMLAHLGGLFAGFIAPLIIWAVKKDESEFVGYHALQALIWHGAFTAIMLVVITPITFITCGAGAVLVFPMIAVQIAFCIIHGLKANEGEWSGYPLLAHFGRPPDR